MRLFVTIFEETPAAAIEAIRAIDIDHDGVEVRAEKFRSYDPAELRAATPKPIMLTHRGAPATKEVLQEALYAGIDLVDVEWGSPIEVDRDRVVLSHHDYEGMPDVESLMREMRATGCRATKLSVTPRNYLENSRLLRLIEPGVTVIGMGERGLYSRVLAPFLGSDFIFAGTAAPGMISLEQATAIYGDRSVRADKVFAIAGNPSGHSLSPTIHNPLFREKGVSGAYTFASFETFEEIAAAMLRDEIAGLSITKPFKEEAYAFAVAQGAEIGENAREAGAVNTLVHAGRMIADNTDVDGFNILLSRLCGRDRKSVALIGAGGTARAALVAIRRAGMHVTQYNRTPRAGLLPLAELARFDGEIIINTTPATDLALPLRPGMTVIESAYGSGTLRAPHPHRSLATLGMTEGVSAMTRGKDGVEWIDGLELLHAQAIRQNELFMKVFDGS